MNPIASWILEALAATIIIMICLSAPEILSFPRWTIAFFGIPVVLYLMWRLESEAFLWRTALVIAVLLAALMVSNSLLVPEAWHPWSSIVIVCAASLIGSRLSRKKGPNHAEPIA